MEGESMSEESQASGIDRAIKDRNREVDEMQIEIVKKLAKNPKVIEALKNLLEPLKQEGDKLTIKCIHKKVLGEK